MLSLSSARDGDSTGTGGGSSVLPESERLESELERTLRSQLAAVTQELEKVSIGRQRIIWTRPGKERLPDLKSSFQPQ